MRKVIIYSLLVLGLGATMGSCGLFKGKKDRCPAYTSNSTQVEDNLAFNE